MVVLARTRRSESVRCQQVRHVILYSKALMSSDIDRLNRDCDGRLHLPSR